MKTRIQDLAIFGGTPAFAQPLHVGRPNIMNKERFITYLNDILDRQWLTNNGPFLQELEKRIADRIGVRHCILVCNGTIALELMIRGLDLTGEVIIPSYTFIATAHALSWLGIKPVFCDIDPFTHNINPAQIEKHITSNTSAILGVHLWGRPCDTEALETISQKFKIKLLYDAAHAFACSYKGRMIGGFGDAEAFSFHATKFFHTIEGGAVTTQKDDVADRIRLMRNFGFAGHDRVTALGINGKLNEVSAAMGLTLLEQLESCVTHNLSNYISYKRTLESTPGVSLIEYPQGESCNYQYIVLEIDPDTFGIPVSTLVEILRAENILARRYYYPGCHRMQPYLSTHPDASEWLPETEKLSERVFCLPTGTSIEITQINDICQILEFIGNYADGIRSKFSPPYKY